MGKHGIRYHRDPKYRARILDNSRRWRANHPDAWKKYHFGVNNKNILLKKKEYRKKTKLQQKKYHQLWAQERKYKVFSWYSNGIPVCVCCGETYLAFLSIDHIDGGGAKHRETLTVPFYNWLINNNFPSGYQVMCMNCQFAKKINGSCSPSNHKAVRLEN